MTLPSEREGGQPRLLPARPRLERRAHMLEEGCPAAGHQRLESRVRRGPDGGQMGPQSPCCLVHKVRRQVRAPRAPSSSEALRLQDMRETDDGHMFITRDSRIQGLEAYNNKPCYFNLAP